MDIIKEAYDGELLYLENTLELDILSRNLNYDFDRLNTFYEDDNGDGADTEGTPEQKKFLERVLDGIVAMCRKIREVIGKFFDKIAGMKSQTISAEDYVNSSKGQAEVNRRFMEVQKEIDEFYRQNRPIVAAISNITGCDIAVVEKKCDALNNFIEKVNWTDVAGTVIREQAKMARWKKYAEDSKAWSNRAEEATKQIKAHKKGIKAKRKEADVLRKYLHIQTKFTAKLFAQNAG